VLTSTELAGMQAVQATTMTQTATITRRTRVSDGMGGHTEAEATSTAFCRLAPTANMPVATIYAGRLGERLPWRCAFPVGTDVEESDMVTVDGRDFEILGILGPYGLATALICICAERE
jgi:hypothetical protein